MCQEFCPQRGGGCLPRYNPCLLQTGIHTPRRTPGQPNHPPAATASDGTHPIGMHSFRAIVCHHLKFICFFYLFFILFTKDTLSVKFHRSLADWFQDSTFKKYLLHLSMSLLSEFIYKLTIICCKFFPDDDRNLFPGC